MNFVLPQAELRRRISKLLDERESNGWTPTALSEAMELNSSTDLHAKFQRGKWMSRNEQIRASRILHLIETGRLKPVTTLINRGWRVGTTTRAMRCEPEAPPPPKTLFRVQVSPRRGLSLKIEKERIYSDADLYLKA